MSETWAIILAAGSSTRMKKQKLLLPFNGITIIETVVENAMQVVGNNVMVVLGANKPEFSAQLTKYEISSCYNENHLDGMLTSAICGFQSLPESAKAALVFLGDQPQIQPAVSKLVIEASEKSEKRIVVPVFQKRRGHPALIDTRFIPEIEILDQNRGLKQLLEKHPEEILEVDCTMQEILRDIDTPEEYITEINKL